MLQRLPIAPAQVKAVKGSSIKYVRKNLSLLT